MQTQTVDGYYSQADLKMIEFKGTYVQNGNMDVLVQYDGVLLHVWHLADPFYRLISSDVFQIGRSNFKSYHTIRLPNGGYIETDNLQAVDLLMQHHRYALHKRSKIGPHHLIIALIGVFMLFAAFFWLSPL